MRYLIILIVLLLFIPTTIAQDTTPVVYGVLYYSPTCPHCHDVINNSVPLWEEEFGDSFILLFVDVTTQYGSYIFFATCDALGVPEDDCGSVPMMVIGTEVMWGSRDIPARTPQLIRDGLEAGGIGLPPVPELIRAYEMSLEAEATEEATEEAATGAASNITDETTTASEEIEAEIVTDVEDVATATWVDKFNADRTGNSIAVVTLIALFGSIFLVFRLGNHQALIRKGLIGLMIIGMMFVLSLALNSEEDTLATVMSWGAFACFGIGAMMLFSNIDLQQVIPLVGLAGLLVAIYLAQVEVSEATATCGAIGNCNAVQQSDYSKLFGVLPIGVLGIVGYVGILVVWVARRMIQWADTALFLMTAFGVIFSIYLTFLEPFVIGATCTWCITSALTMMILLWMNAPLVNVQYN